MSRPRSAVLTLGVIAWITLLEGAAAARVNRLDLLSLVAASVLAIAAYLLHTTAGSGWVPRLLWAAAAVNPVGDIGDAFGPSPGAQNVLPEPVGSWVDQIARAGRWWAVVPLAAALLLYPSRRFERRSYSWFVGAGVIVFVLVPSLEILAYDKDRFNFSGVPGWVTVVPGGEAVRLPLLDASRVGGIAFSLVGVLLMIQRWRNARGPVRVAIRPVAIVGVVLGLALAAQCATNELGPGRLNVVPGSWETVSVFLTQAAMALAPVVLLLEALRRRAEQVRLLDQLLASGGDPEAIQRALALALDDPLLRLGIDVEGRWVDAAGVAQPEKPMPGRLRHPVTVRDGHVAAQLETSREALQDPVLLRTALHAASVVLENMRLQAALSARLQEVALSRARIVEAGLAERRRVERDLHDGAQQQLLAVAASLGRARFSPDERAARAAVEEAALQLGEALGELRRLARGIHPAVLTQGGLPAALPSLAQLTDVPVEIDVGHELRTVRPQPAVEATAWFIAAECVANAVKHAGCTAIRIAVRFRGNGDEDTLLVLTVSDDGRGGATIVAGGGLAGLVDRTGAMGGEISFSSPLGGGTMVEAAIPCGL